MDMTQEDELKYKDMVKVLAKPGKDIVASLTAFDAHVLHMAVGISGESGELLDAVKKGTIYQKPFDLQNIVEELGDLEFYMEGLRTAFNISREETLLANMRKLEKRYDGQYSDKAAQERKDKQ